MKKALLDAMRPFGFLETSILETEPDVFRIAGAITVSKVYGFDLKPMWWLRISAGDKIYSVSIRDEKEAAAIVVAAMLIQRAR